MTTKKTDTDAGVKVLGLHVTDYKGLKFFAFDRAGKMNALAGPNGSGKSSVLDAIREALKSSGKDVSLIRNGADKAIILLRLDNGVEVERRITASGNTVKVTREGAPVAKPQSYLDGLLGQYSLNPIALFNADPRARRQAILSAIPFVLDADTIREGADDDIELLDLANVDWSRHGLELLAELKQQVYDRRTEQGRIVTRLEKALEQDRRDMPEVPDGERFADFDQERALDELRAAERALAEHKAKVERRASMRQRSVQLATEIEAARKRLDDLEHERQMLVDDGTKLSAEIEAFEAPDVEALRKRQSDWNQFQRVLGKLEEMTRRTVELAEEKTTHERLDRLHGVLRDDLPRRVFQTAALPVEGLAIDGDEITVNGVPIDKLSTSEKMRFAVSMARSLAGEAKFICVDGWEACDSKTRAAFEAEVSDDDYQYFIAVVGDQDALTLEKR